MWVEQSVFGSIEANVEIPTPIVQEFQDFSRRVICSSTIVWAEHCSECSVPQCYTTCSYYSPRADLTCRRFVAGIEPVHGIAHARLHRMRFRKWGKLEGSGPVSVRPIANIEFRHSVNSKASALLRGVPQPFRLRRYLNWRWNSLQKKLANHYSGLELESFALETWAVDGLTHPFTITFLGQEKTQIYQERFEIGPKYKRTEIPVDRILQHVDLAEPYLVQIEPSGQKPGCDIVLGFADFVTYSQPERLPLPASKGIEKRAKVIVWDLDNTLWDGILAEDGLDGIQLRSEMADVVVELDRRGILHSVASKNDESIAVGALKRFGLFEYFLCPQIGWQPKSESLQIIAQTLDLGIDSFVFVDDQAFERGEVKEALPSVMVMSDSMAKGLPENPICDVTITAESKSRRAMYQAEALRTDVLQTSKTDYMGFLKSCRIVLELTTPKTVDRDRIYELSQRTNQLNFCGTKYSKEMANDLVTGAAGVRCFVLRCLDKFGEYGVIGFAVVDVTQGLVVDFFMSCRVQRKQVESAFFSVLAKELLRGGCSQMGVRVQRTDRNAAAFEMLKQLGFQPDGISDSPERWRRDLATDFPHSDIVEVVYR